MSDPKQTENACLMEDQQITKTVETVKSIGRLMRWKSGLAKTPSRKTRNSMRKGAVVASVLLLCSVTCVSSEKPLKEVIAPCRISVPREVREATFVAVYKFEVNAGKPVNIRKVKNDFLKDDDFTACISGWRLPSLSGKGVAQFFYKTGEGWTEMTVSGKGFDKSFHFANDDKGHATLKPSH
jgi:hypothetical protein